MKRSMTHYSVNELLLEWYHESHSPYPIQFSYAKGEVFIYTPYPGYLIGKAGHLFYKYKQKFEDTFTDFSKITLLEVHRVEDMKLDNEDY